VDKNLPFQQNLATLPIALVVLDSVSNELPALLPLVPALLRELSSLQPKSYTFGQGSLTIPTAGPEQPPFRGAGRGGAASNDYAREHSITIDVR
jgi:hypothetical protein